MGILAVVSLVVFLLLGVLAAANWSTFTMPLTLSLLVTTVEAPFGLLMLAVVVLIAVVNIGVTIAWRTSMLVESRRLSRELQTQREVAERAEASRLAELRGYVERELADLRTAITDAVGAASSRVDTVDQSVRDSVREGVNSVMASIGELEDKLERGLPRPERVDR
jgi:hypothetical protein